MLESNSTLALFIVDLRSKSGHDLDEYLLHHQLQIASHEKNTGNTAFDLFYQHFFLAANNYQFAHIHFSRAVASTERKIKRLGYLGATFTPDPDFHKCIFAYIKNDILDPNSQRYVINYLSANLNNQEFYKPLMPRMKNLMMGHTFKLPATVIYYKCVSTIDGLSLFEKTEDQFLVKLQIVIDKLNGEPNSSDIKFLDSRNEIDLVCTMLRKSEKYFVKMKCVQFLSILQRFKHHFESWLYKYVEDSINVVRLLKKPAAEIGYYVESVKFLLNSGINSNKTHSFVFKMLESKHEIYIKIASRFSMKFGVYRDVAIEKCIFVGLNDEDILESFLKMIDRQNYRAIYKRKQEIILTLEGRDCSDAEIDEIVEKFLRKIFEFTDSKEAAQIYLEEPTFCIKQPIFNHVIEEDRKKMYAEIKDKKDWMYFALIYQTLGNRLETEQHQSMITSHLTVLYEYSLVNCCGNILYTITYLLSLLPTLKNFKLIQNMMIKMYSENARRNTNHALMGILLSKIMFFNIFLDEKVVFMGDDIFLWYKIIRDGKFKKIKLRCKPDIFEIFVKNSKRDFEAENVDVIGDEVERTYGEVSNNLVVTCLAGNCRYETKIMISES